MSKKAASRSKVRRTTSSNAPSEASRSASATAGEAVPTPSYGVSRCRSAACTKQKPTGVIVASGADGHLPPHPASVKSGLLSARIVETEGRRRRDRLEAEVRVGGAVVRRRPAHPRSVESPAQG